MKNFNYLTGRSANENQIFFTLLILICLNLNTFSQSFPDNPTQIKEVPSSPTMWGFEKYGNYPVSMHTGVPNISIPIATATSGELQVPITLSYHASGIKVDQKASWVGLGWELMAGGAITRTVRGGNDESINGYIDYPYDELNTYNVTNNLSENEYRIIGSVDTEPDIFNYNFMGYTGRFIFNHATSRTSATIAMIPHNDLKITPTFSGAQIASFTIITPEGIKAEFAYPEISSEYRPANLLGDYTVTANNVWHLKKLTAINGVDEINFEYDLVPSVNLTNGNTYSGFVTEERISQSERINYFNPCNSFDFTRTMYTNGLLTIYYQVKRLKKITHRNGYILFESSAGNRLDDPEDEGLRLDAIKLYSSLNGINSLIKTYNLEYDYFGNYNPLFSNPAYSVRLELTKITEEGANNAAKPPYQFFYKDSGLDKLPYRFSFSQDYWGYFNGFANSSLLPSYQYQMHNGNTTTLGNANRNPHTSRAKAGIIEKIIYPTKGYSLFEFESNRATVIENNVPLQKVAGGLRIKNISNFDTNNNLQWQKSYEYVQPQNISLSSGIYNGNQFIKPQDFFHGRSYYFNQYIPGCPNGDTGTPRDHITYTEAISSSPTLGNNFASVFYSDVKEYNGSPTNHKGYTWYHYDTTKDDFVQGLGPISFIINHNWERGQLLKEETFENGNPSPIKTITNTYEKASPQAAISGYKLGTRYDVEALGYSPGLPGAGGPFYATQYFLTYYNEPIELKRLKSKVTVEDNITTTINYHYHNTLKHTNLIRSSSTGSNGEVTEIKTYYPDDVTSTSSLEGGTLSLPNYNAIVKMKANGTNRRVGTPLQTVNTFNGNKTIVRTNFKTWSNGLELPEFVQTSKGTGVLQSRAIYHDYDNEGRPLEISKTNDKSVTYIWGYEKQYPIAKIENATYAQVSSQVANLQNKSNADIDRTQGSAGTEGALRLALSNLRNSLPNAMVTTYTYDPLIGVTSITDPTGYTMYYEYDEFNRLKQIIDADGFIITEHQYHFKGQ